MESKIQVVYLIIQYYHKLYLDVSPQTLLFHVRQKYWPLNCRTMCRKIEDKCMTFFKTKLEACEQVMGDLSKDGIVFDFPFNCCEVDFQAHFF